MHLDSSGKSEPNECKASRASIKYHRVNSASSLPLVVPRPSPCHRILRSVRSCTMIQSRQWVRFVLLLGDPLVTCLALFGGLLLIGGTLMTSLAYMPMSTSLRGVALTDTLETARVIGPVLIGLGAVFLSSSVFNHQILLKRDRLRRKHNRNHKIPDDASCAPSIRRSRKLPSAGKQLKVGRRPPLPPSCPSVHQVAVPSVDCRPPTGADGNAPPSVIPRSASRSSMTREPPGDGA